MESETGTALYRNHESQTVAGVKSQQEISLAVSDWSRTGKMVIIVRGSREFRVSPPGELMNFDRITHNPSVMGGQPCIRGMRITAGTVLGLLSEGVSASRILEAYPHLEAADIEQVLAYAAWRLQEREVALVPA